MEPDKVEAGLPGTAMLRLEHRFIVRVATVLEQVGRRMARGRAVDPVLVRDVVDLLQLVDRSHHQKEEEHLFPTVSGMSLATGSPIATLVAEHQETRDYVQTLTSLARSTRPDATAAAAALLCVTTLREHVEREDRALFPAIDAALSPAEHAALARRYEEVVPRLVGPGADPEIEQRLLRLEAAFA